MTVADLLRAAGPILWVLVALSIYVVYLSVLQGLRLRRLASDPDMALQRANIALSQHDASLALWETSRATTPAANVLRAGLQRAQSGIPAAEAAMNEALIVEDRRAYAGIAALGTIAQLAPLLGLLGTVLGMSRAFLVFSNTAAPAPSQLATGISEALVNTGAGLIVAITAYFARGFLRAQADTVMTRADRVREMLPAWLREIELRGGAPAVRPEPIEIPHPRPEAGQRPSSSTPPA